MKPKACCNVAAEDAVLTLPGSLPRSVPDESNEGT